jgi:HK97 family phage prohead protease
MSKKYLKGIAVKSETGYRVLASTNAVDRQGDVVDQGGWDLKNFLLNPVILWAHKYDELPVGKATKVQITSQGLELDFEFAPAEANAKAEEVRNCFEQGFLNAVSVGFIPKERSGNTITKAELLEVSIVPVPANQEALRLAMSKGFDLKEIVADIEKGEVQDVIDDRDVMEQKYENLDEVWGVISALCQTYCDPSTAVDDFSKLLLETVSILTNIANGETVEPTEASTASFTEYAGKKLGIEKEGRVLSDKNRKLIGDCISTMKGSVAVLEDLHSATASSTVETAVAPEIVDEKVVKISKDELTMIRQQFRAIDRQNEVALSLVGKFLSSKE